MQNDKNSKDIALSFVLLNYNNADYTVPCIRSIKEEVTVPHEIIVVDNASTDNSIEQLSQVDEIKLLRNATNRGFTGGNNDAVKLARGKYIVILNNDTTVYDSNIDELPTILDSLGKYDVVGGRIVGTDGEGQSCGGYEPRPIHFFLQFTILCYKKIRLPWLKDFWFYEWNKDEIKEADWAVGCFFAMRRDTFLDLGGFDERIFIYLDEVDLHKRMRKLGGRILLYPNIVILHYGQISWGDSHYIGLRHNYNSALYYLEKYYGQFYKYLFVIVVKTVNLFYLPVLSLLRLVTRGRKEKINTKMKFCLTLLFA
jgi:GT2 family glycosyltransferase